MAYNQPLELTMALVLALALVPLPSQLPQPYEWFDRNKENRYTANFDQLSAESLLALAPAPTPRSLSFPSPNEEKKIGVINRNTVVGTIINIIISIGTTIERNPLLLLSLSNSQHHRRHHHQCYHHTFTTTKESSIDQRTDKEDPITSFGIKIIVSIVVGTIDISSSSNNSINQQKLGWSTQEFIDRRRISGRRL